MLIVEMTSFNYLFMIFILHVGTYMKQQEREIGLLLFYEVKCLIKQYKNFIKTSVQDLPHLTTSVIITVLLETRHVVSSPNYVS